MELDPLTVLDKRFSIQRTLGEPDPFAIRYLAENTETGQQVVVREFFPDHLVGRPDGTTTVTAHDDEADSAFQTGVQYFQKETEVLQGLDHDALPSGYEYIEANGTAYRVRDRIPGASLDKVLQAKGNVSERAALTIMVPVLNALQTVHDGRLYHGGVAPGAIRLHEETGKPYLVRFQGASVQLARNTERLDDVVEPGFSPIELYSKRGTPGTETDVYAAAATICHAITGRPIPEATDRLQGDDTLEGLVQDADAFSSPGVRDVLTQALTVNPKHRLRSVEALEETLKEASERYDEGASGYTIAPVERDEPSPQQTPDDEPDTVEVEPEPDEGPAPEPAAAPAGAGAEQDDEDGGTSWAVALGIPVLLLATLGGGVYLMMGGGSASGSSGSSGSYSQYVQQADSLFASSEYEAARNYYRRAREERPEDPYVIQRLNRIEELQPRQERFTRQLERGDSLRNRGNRLFENEQYEQAREAYSRANAAYIAAQDARPSSGEVEQRLETIDEQITDVYRRKLSNEQTAGSETEGESSQMEELYQAFRERGDREFEAGNYRAARRSYQRALDFKPDDRYVQNRLSQTEERVQAQEQRDEFERLLERGRRLMADGQHEAAQSALERAATIQSDSRRLQAALQRNDSLMQADQEAADQYQRYRSAGDASFEAGNYQEALTSYQKALDYRPDDEYAQRRAQEAKEKLEQLRLAQEKQQSEQKKERMKEGDVFMSVDQEAKPVGGLSALHKRADYPASARRAGIEGRVYVQAVINADGSVREAKVVRGIGGGCDEEALQVVRNAKFEPAQVDGEAVASRRTVFIQFELAD